MIDRNRIHRRTKILQCVNREANQFYAKSQELGILAAEAFQGQQNKTRREQHRSQMTGLENVAETTMKVSDVLDYIKKQTARQPGWHTPYEKKRLSEILDNFQETQEQEYTGKCFGEILKNYIETDLAVKQTSICNSLGLSQAIDDDLRDRQQIHLHLIRQFVRQLVVQYEYKVSEWERKRNQENESKKQ